MILLALTQYYDRAKDMAPEGWEWRPIPFLIEIAADGRFLQLSDMRSGLKSKDAKEWLVPKAKIRSGTKSFEKPNMLWDRYEFVLGVPKSDKESDVITGIKQRGHFSAAIRSLAAELPDNQALRAITLFYENGEYNKVLESPIWPDCYKIPGCNLMFRIAGEISPVVHDESIRRLIDSKRCEASNENPLEATCSVSGIRTTIQKLHFPIAGICEKPAPMSAVNDGACPAFSSFLKKQGYNFPVGVEVAFKYATALNYLLRHESPQKIKMGETIAVFWAESEDKEAESGFAAAFGEPNDPDRTELVRGVLSAIQSRQFDGGRGEKRFYVLGLAPNAARISIRFWCAAPLHEIAQRIRQWFDDLRLIRSGRDSEYPSLFRLLAACAQQGKADNIPPNLGGDIMRSILSGGPLPATWLNAAVQRCRAEQSVTYLRAAAIKACLNRSRRSSDSSFIQEFSDMLDLANTNKAYRLGRLFAVLEKIQEEANPGLNATIRERYYGAASSTPVAVFTTLLRLKNHHLAKLTNRGRVVNFERLLGEILGTVADFPKHLNLPDQGRFSLGYYHQRQDFFNKPAQSDESNQGDSK